jgi:uncharacterized membrane protein YhfC
MALSPVALIGGLGMIAVALGFVAYALVRRLGWGYLLLGMVGWIVTVAVKFAFAIPVNPIVLNETAAFSEPWKGIVLFLYGGLMTGLTEVLLVWIVLRYTQLAKVTWSRVVAFGLGFGAIEALLLGAGSLTAAMVGIFATDILPEVARTELAKADRLAVQLAPISERFFTCLGHLATCVMIFYAARVPRIRWFWWALIYKSAIDGVATLAHTHGFLGSTVNLWIIEGIVVVWALAGVAVTLAIRRRWPDPVACDVLDDGSRSMAASPTI